MPVGLIFGMYSTLALNEATGCIKETFSMKETLRTNLHREIQVAHSRMQAARGFCINGSGMDFTFFSTVKVAYLVSASKAGPPMRSS